MLPQFYLIFQNLSKIYKVGNKDPEKSEYSNLEYILSKIFKIKFNL